MLTTPRTRCRQIGHAPLRVLFLAVCVTLVLAGAGWAAADGATLEGMITDQATRLPIDAADIRLLDSEGEQVHRARANGFGLFRIRGIAPGTYTVEARHRGYHPQSEAGFVITEDESHHWHAALTFKHPSFDLFVEVACVMTGIRLRDIPVDVTVTPIAGGAAPFQMADTTDEQGVVQFPGVPEAFITLAINDGPTANSHWEAFHHVHNQGVNSHHWADVLLKPHRSQITVAVTGFDPVTEEDGVLLGGVVVECRGVHPDDPDIDLLPPQIGETGLRKEDDPSWDNVLAGKVRFEGLPHIHWMLDAKRLGYRIGSRLVTELPANDETIALEIQDTTLTVVLETPYNDPEMLNGLKVRLQGLKDSHTEGIDRERTAVYVAEEQRAIVVFDRILPGNYRVSANQLVTRVVPIVVDDVQIYNYSSAPNRFRTRLTGTDYVMAAPDENLEVAFALAPETVVLRGQLLLVDEPYIEYPKQHPGIEIHASEYYKQHIPEAYHKTVVDSDENGEFMVTLIPGLYGVCIPGLDEYWGERVRLRTTTGGIEADRGWPYYQVWPYGPDAANFFFYSIGGFGISSGTEPMARFVAYRKTFGFDLRVYEPDHPLAEGEMVAARYPSDELNSWDPITFPVCELEGVTTIQIRGPENRDLAWPATVPTVMEPGTYTVDVLHPRFQYQTQTVTVRDFGTPGYLPPAPPPVFGSGEPFPLSDAWVEFGADYPGCGIARITTFAWDTQFNPEGEYFQTGESRMPEFIQVGYHGSRIFKYNRSTLPPPYYRAETPPTPYTVWKQAYDAYGTYWYAIQSSGGNLDATVYVGGPLATPKAGSADTWHPVSRNSYRIIVEAREYFRRDETIQGATVVFGPPAPGAGTDSLPANGMLVTDRKRPYQVNDVLHPEWTYPISVYQDRVEYRRIDAQTVGVTVYLMRGIQLKGQVRNAESGAVITDARIQLHDAQGHDHLFSRTYDEEGVFTMRFALNYMDYFVDFEAAGFLPTRVRITPEMAVAGPGDGELTISLTGEDAIRLTPIQRPDILAETLTMDRRGAFLPGVKNAGNQSAFNAFTADGPLTLSWSVDVSMPQQDYTVTLPGFDQPDGTPGSDEVVNLQETIREVWLVDMKSFPDHAYDDEPVLLSLPAEFESQNVLALLNGLRTGTGLYANVYYQRLTDFAALPADPDTVRVSGDVKLWQLPPDRFEPAVIALSKLGATAVYRLEYTGGWAGRELTGARLPPWFAAMADIMGSVAGAQALLGDGLKDALPKGRFIAMPAFTADIVLRPTGALDYVYSLDTQVKEGMASDLGGIMGLAPGFMGVSLYGGIEATLKGEDREFYVQMKGGVSRRSVNRQDYVPSFFKKLGDVKVGLSPQPSGEFYHIDSYTFDADNFPEELAVLYGVSGQVGARMSVSIMPTLKYIPKIGPVLLTLYETGGLDIRALVTGLIGVRSLSGFKTTFPRRFEHYYGQGPETRQLRRHFLGGDETGEFGLNLEQERSLDLAVGFGVGLEALLAGGRAGANGMIKIAGNDAWTGAPALLIDVNPDGDWPLIRRLRGDLRAELEAYLDLWVARLQRKWKWTLWPIDQQFGTESAINLMAIEITVLRRDLGQADPADLLGDLPVVIDRFPMLGIFAVAGGDGDLLVYTDADSLGHMTLRGSAGNATDGRQAPVDIAVLNGAAVDLAALTLADGTRLVVWTEIAASDYLNPFPPSKIMVSLGNAAGTLWSAPVQAAVLDAVAVNLRLVARGDAARLLFSLAAAGPVGGYQGVYGMTFQDGTWSAMDTLTSDAISGLEAAGSDDPGQRPCMLAWRSASGALSARAWTDPLDAPAGLVEQTGRAFGLFGSGTRTYLVYDTGHDSLGGFEHDADTGEWRDLGILFSDAAPFELTLGMVVEDDREWLVALWTQSRGDAMELVAGVIDPLNPEPTPGRAITPADGQFLQPILSLPDPDGRLHVTTQWRNSDGARQIHAYLLDALPDDGYEQWADDVFGDDLDVLGGRYDDPNQTGLNNLQAYVADLDPLDPQSRPPRLDWHQRGLRIQSSSDQRDYRVDSRTNLLHGDWQFWTNRAGTGDALWFDVEPGAAERFFRYRIRLPD